MGARGFKTAPRYWNRHPRVAPVGKVEPMRLATVTALHPPEPPKFIIRIWQDWWDIRVGWSYSAAGALQVQEWLEYEIGTPTWIVKET